MRRLAAATFALALGGCWTVAPEPVPEAAVAPPQTSAIDNIEVVTSPGGVTAWLVSESFVPIVAMEMAWQGGAAVEPASKRGAGWVLGYMMNEGAGQMDTSAYGARMEDLNMKFACGVWIDWTSCGMTTLKDTADESFDMVRQAFAAPRFDDEPFERAKRELVAGLKQDETNPRNIAAKAMNTYLIPNHPYARETTPETVARITKPDTQALMKQLMTRDRLLVVVVGDITAEELKPKLDEVFGALPATSELPDVPDAQAKGPAKNPIVKQLPLPQTLVMFSGPGVSRDDPDFYAAYTLNYILGGGGFSSRLTDDIREKRGLTYGIGTGLSVQPHFWRWTGSSSTMNDKTDEVVERIKENIARLGEEGPTAQELRDAKEYLTGSFPLAFDSNAKIAKNLMSFRQDGMGADYVEKRNGYFNAVTLEDLKRVAKQYMKPENFTFVMVGKSGE
jgi:zinc protease